MLVEAADGFDELSQRLGCQSLALMNGQPGEKIRARLLGQAHKIQTLDGAGGCRRR